MEHKIELTIGFEDKDGKLHREVVFGKRLTVGDVMLLDTDPQAKNPTQYVDLLTRKCITKFGDLKCPVSLDKLLGLNSVDREDLARGFSEFLEMTRPVKEREYGDDHTVTLSFGFEIDGTVYDRITFGKLTTGRDEVEADQRNLTGVARECFMIDRQLAKLETSDGTASIDGDVGIGVFSSLDAADLNTLRIGAIAWRSSFRNKGKDVPEIRDGKTRGVTDEGAKAV